MNQTTHPCPTETLLQYHDDELPLAERQRIAAHLESCSSCRHALDQHVQLGRMVRKAADAAAAQTPRPDVAGVLVRRIKTDPPRHGRRSWRPRRWVPAGVLASALLVVLIIYSPWQTRLEGPELSALPEPSAIVESFHGNVSTVMILETQTTGQTIVWFNEIDEPDGENNGNQSAPPTVGRDAHPAAGQQWGLGRA